MGWYPLLLVPGVGARAAGEIPKGWCLEWGEYLVVGTRTAGWHPGLVPKNEVVPLLLLLLLLLVPEWRGGYPLWGVSEGKTQIA